MSVDAAIPVESQPHEKHAPALPAPENKLYFPALDGLRAVALLMVFSSHTIDLPPALSWGFTGVDLFFVLSGFLITGILYDSQNRPDRFRVFYMRRTLRIFPLYYGVLLLPVLLYPVFRWQLHPAQWLWPVYLGNYARFLWPGDVVRGRAIFEDIRSTAFPGFAYQMPHLWSLCVEEQFYLVWPLVVFTLRRRTWLRNLCLAMVIAVPLLRLLALHVLSHRLLSLGLLYRATPLRADALLVGGAVALCLRGPESRRLQALGRPLILLLVLLALSIEIVSRARLGHFVDADWSQLYSPWGYSLVAAGAACLLLLALQPGSLMYRFCVHPALRWLGLRSYGFYVYHLLLGQVWGMLALALFPGHRRAAHLALPAVAFAGTLLVAWASFRYFESPILRLKARFA